MPITMSAKIVTTATPGVYGGIQFFVCTKIISCKNSWRAALVGDLSVLCKGEGIE